MVQKQRDLRTSLRMQALVDPEPLSISKDTRPKTASLRYPPGSLAAHWSQRVLSACESTWCSSL